MNSLISIIVPTYMSADKLQRCVQSLLNQTYEHIEIIIVENGSHEVESVINVLKELDSRVKYVYRDEAGVSAARNAGLAIAKGDYIAFCDSDDWMEPDCLEIMLENSKRFNAPISAIDYIKPNPGVTNIQCLNPKDYITEIVSDEGFKGVVWNKLFTKQAVSNVCFRENIRVCEDMTFCVDVLSNLSKDSVIVVDSRQKYHFDNSHANMSIRRGFETSIGACDAILERTTKMFAEEHLAIKYIHRMYLDRIAGVCLKSAIKNELSRAKYKEFQSSLVMHKGFCDNILSKALQRKIKALSMPYLVFICFSKIYYLLRK